MTVDKEELTQTVVNGLVTMTRAEIEAILSAWGRVELTPDITEMDYAIWTITLQAAPMMLRLLDAIDRGDARSSLMEMRLDDLRNRTDADPIDLADEIETLEARLAYQGDQK